MRITLLALSLFACNGDNGGGSDTDGGSDNGNDDNGTDSGSNTGQCDDTPSTPAPGSGPAACYTAELDCGDSVTHTTTGGETNLSEGYSTGAWACIGSDPLTADYSAPERRYTFSAPEGTEPVVTLESDCNLTMKVLRRSTGCPTDASQVTCWDAVGDFDESIQTHTFFPGLDYEIIVEGVDGGEGAFTLDIVCP